MAARQGGISDDRLANRDGNPRHRWDLERLARHHAAKLGYRVHRSRRRKGPDNAGGLMLIHKASSTVLLGAGYTATVEMILKFMERERMHSSTPGRARWSKANGPS